MYLFDKREDYIDVYEMKPNEKLKEYKIKELEECEVKSIQFNTESSAKDLFAADNVTIPELKEYNVGREITITPDALTKEFIKDYIDGKYSVYSPKIVTGNKKSNSIESYLNYLIYTRKTVQDKSNYYSLLTVIYALLLNENLYKLQLIESGKFKLLNSEFDDFDEQLDLFDLAEDPIDEFNLEELRRLSLYGAVDFSGRDISKKVDRDRIILERKL